MKILYSVFLLLLITSCNNLKKDNETSQYVDYLSESEEQKDQRMKWWREARFGMFIHWGPSAVWAGEWDGKKSNGFSEWIMSDMQIPIKEYEILRDEFNPSEFEATEWVALAKAAGMKYVIFTSKHHDGFAMWDSKYSDWNIGGTKFKRDIVKELKLACQKADIKFGIYYSITDWHNMDAQGQFYPNYNIFPEEDSLRKSATFRKYLDEKMKPQLEELLSDYGEIGVLWFDGEWINDYTSEMGKEIYQFVRTLQPSIIINNRVDKGRKGMQGLNKEGYFAGDFGTPEQEIPETGLAGIDWETCQTLNESWGYKYFDSNWKSDSTMICQLVDIASKGGNLLLNIGPTAEGIIPKESVNILEAMGNWIAINGESIYGTIASPIKAPEWGRITQTKTSLYLHVFHWPKNGILSLNLNERFSEATLLSTGNKLKLSFEEGVVLYLADNKPDKICTVIKLEKVH